MTPKCYCYTEAECQAALAAHSYGFSKNAISLGPDYQAARAYAAKMGPKWLHRWGDEWWMSPDPVQGWEMIDSADRIRDDIPSLSGK